MGDRKIAIQNIVWANWRIKTFYVCEMTRFIQSYFNGNFSKRQPTITSTDGRKALYTNQIFYDERAA